MTKVPTTIAYARSAIACASFWRCDLLQRVWACILTRLAMTPILNASGCKLIAVRVNEPLLLGKLLAEQIGASMAKRGVAAALDGAGD